MYKIICQKSCAIENWTQTFCPDIGTRWVKDELDYMSKSKRLCLKSDRLFLILLCGR